MSSLVPGYEYDIFISYRQKDNKYDGWVTGFVANLKSELDATFVEEISVYFDINPEDGLLENHDVNDSLKEKLKCLVFIPVISRTYCKAGSFAWENEFKAFVELAKEDQFGLKVKLQNGNVASRVLPVRIYDLSSNEVELCEAVTEGVLRGIDFVFKAPGVNRPLRAHEDHPADNINKTYYRDQINKVANSIKEIIDACTGHTAGPVANYSGNKHVKPVILKSKKARIFVTALIIIALVSTGLLFGDRVFRKEMEKSIAVLPFDNLTGDNKDPSYSKGLPLEIMNRLFKIEGLEISASSSSFIYEDSKLSRREIAKELNKSYLLTGSRTESNGVFTLIVELIRGSDEKLLWRHEYPESSPASDILEIPGDIVNKVAGILKIEIDPEVKKRIDNRPTENQEAYELYLEAISLIKEGNLPHTNREFMDLLYKAISLDPEFADAYAVLAFSFIYGGGHGGFFTSEEAQFNIKNLLSKALQSDANSALAHAASGIFNLYYVQDFKKVETEYEIVKKLDPSNSELIAHFSDHLMASGRYEEALTTVKNAFRDNPEELQRHVALSLAFFFMGQADSSSFYMYRALNRFPENEHLLLHLVRIKNYMGEHRKALDIYHEKHNKNNPYHSISYFLGHLGVAHIKTGNENAADTCLKKLILKSEASSEGSASYFTAAIYTAMGQTEDALEMIKKAIDNKEVEIYWLKTEPLFRSLHGNPEFESLIEKLGYVK
jgi:TolB-like protein/tetratricopeptide (TPR) repeat protein